MHTSRPSCQPSVKTCKLKIGFSSVPELNTNLLHFTVGMSSLHVGQCRTKRGGWDSACPSAWWGWACRNTVGEGPITPILVWLAVEYYLQSYNGKPFLSLTTVQCSHPLCFSVHVQPTVLMANYFIVQSK